MKNTILFIIPLILSVSCSTKGEVENSKEKFKKIFVTNVSSDEYNGIQIFCNAEESGEVIIDNGKLYYKILKNINECNYRYNIAIHRDTMVLMTKINQNDECDLTLIPEGEFMRFIDEEVTKEMKRKGVENDSSDSTTE